MKHAVSYKSRERVVFKNIEDPVFKETILGHALFLDHLFSIIRTSIENRVESNQKLLTLVEQELEEL